MPRSEPARHKQAGNGGVGQRRERVKDMDGTSVTYWEKAWGRSMAPERYITQNSPFLPLLSRYLPPSPPDHALDFLEIGCFPGRYLYLFAKHFGYRVSGVDFVPQTAAIPAWLADLGVEARVTCADIFEFQPSQQYDVVASFGFIEHFPRWEEVLERHLALLKPGGTLLVECPNFRYGQYWLRWFLNPQFIEGHYLDAMDLSKWEKALTERGLDILYCNYFQTFRVWSALAGRGLLRLLRKWVLKLSRKAQQALEYLNIDYPNKFFSPFIIIVARKPGASGV